MQVGPHIPSRQCVASVLASFWSYCSRCLPVLQIFQHELAAWGSPAIDRRRNQHASCLSLTDTQREHLGIIFLYDLQPSVPVILAFLGQ